MGSKPNVLIILSDQQRYDTVAAAGYKHMITPNLDKLCREGTLFSMAHSGNPVCMPARHDLITGLTAKYHGYYNNSRFHGIRDYSLPTLGRIFSHAGYRTCAVGKMHFHPTREHHGFNEMHLMEEMPGVRADDAYAEYLDGQGLGEVQNIHGVRPHIYRIPQNAPVPAEHHGSTWVASRSIEWLETNGASGTPDRCRDGSRGAEPPFLLMCGFIQPHPPWDIPEEYDGLYDSVGIPGAVQPSRLPYDGPCGANWYGDDDTVEEKEAIRKAYYTAVSMVDENAGRIVEYLRDAGKLDNTLVIFASDHGDMLQDKGYYSKSLPYDSAVRVPLVIRYPEKFPPGERREDFVDLLDILPTCLDVCGLEYGGEHELYGESLTERRERTYQYSSNNGGRNRWVMCRDREYKYVYHYNGGYEELYRCSNPETENLLVGPDAVRLGEKHRELKARALAYEARWGKSVFVRDGDFVPFEREENHPHVRGKHPYWANVNFQNFHEAGRFDRKERLAEEMTAALSNEKKSGVSLERVFREREWCEGFIRGYREFTGEEELDERLAFLKEY